jgi:hypothetical protein
MPLPGPFNPTQPAEAIANLLFALAFLSTVFCLAINAYTFQIGYPLWKLVRPEEFAALHKAYLRQLTWVITAPHILMFFTCGALMFWPPRFMTRGAAALVCAATWSVVALSAFVAGPIHDRFARQGRIDDAGFARLLWVSALRQACMIAASLVLLVELCNGLLH